jgi:hypothetical protein
MTGWPRDDLKRENPEQPYSLSVYLRVFLVLRVKHIGCPGNGYSEIQQDHLSLIVPSKIGRMARKPISVNRNLHFYLLLFLTRICNMAHAEA